MPKKLDNFEGVKIRTVPRGKPKPRPMPEPPRTSFVVFHHESCSASWGGPCDSLQCRYFQRDDSISFAACSWGERVTTVQ
jgi:hypothetical protein